MKNNTIYITGSTGFVGENLIRYLNDFFAFREFKRGESVCIDEEIVIHLAGKAHDLKSTSTPDSYYECNTQLTKQIFDAFLQSDAKIFLTLSSVKADADKIDNVLTEDWLPNPITDYGRSKRLAEEYILSKRLPQGKRIYILRPCMIHGPGNKGNLNLLYKLVTRGIPWPLGAYENRRSFCSVDNLCFIIKEIIERHDIPSGIYNIADDYPLSTNQLIKLIAKSQDRNGVILKVPKAIVRMFSELGGILGLPLNNERLQKLTESYEVSNAKIVKAIGKSLPLSTVDGLIKTLNAFSITNHQQNLD